MDHRCKNRREYSCCQAIGHLVKGLHPSSLKFDRIAGHEDDSIGSAASALSSLVLPRSTKRNPRANNVRETLDPGHSSASFRVFTRSELSSEKRSRPQGNESPSMSKRQFLFDRRMSTTVRAASLFPCFFLFRPRCLLTKCNM
jgi:hypothetical protein